MKRTDHRVCTSPPSSKSPMGWNKWFSPGGYSNRGEDQEHAELSKSLAKENSHVLLPWRQRN